MMDICELPAFYFTKEITAKKEHICCECKAPILRNEKYLLCKGKWGNSIDLFRQHLLCAEACEFIRDNLNDECVPFGDLFEWFRNESSYKFTKNNPDSKKIRQLMVKIIRRQRQ